MSRTEELFWAKVDKSGDCWLWMGATVKGGYGCLTVDMKPKLAHRQSAEWAFGPLPEGAEVDHECHVRRCVRPSHLRVSTRSHNTWNRSGPTKGSKTGARNVYRHGEKYRVEVKKHGKNYRFGTFDTVEDAIPVAEAARRELFGEFAGRG